MDLARALEHGVERAVQWSVQHRRFVLATAAVLTLVLAPGILRVEVHNRMTDWVDPSDPDAAAFLHALEQLPPMVDFERTLLEYAGSDPEGLLGVTSLREQERLVDEVMAQVPAVTGAMGPVVAVQLTAYEMQRARGETPEARLPASDDELRLAIELTKRNQPELLHYHLTDDQRIGFIGFMFDAEPFSPEANRIGGAIDTAIDEAYENGFSTLTGEHRHAIGVASVTHHINGLLRHDILLLGSLGVALVFVLFLLAAGRPVAVLGGFSSLALGLVWTIGVLGWADVPFNTLNFAILPLVMGNGIDYSIHVLAEAHHDRRGFGKGLARHLGKALGVPIVLVTLTTCIGLSTLAWSGSLYLRQMGVLAAASIALIAVLSLTFIPAFLATFSRDDRPPRRERAGSLFVASGRAGRRFPAVVAGLVALSALGGAVALWTTDYRIDVFENSLPAGDPLRAAEDAYEEAWQSTDVWFVIIQSPDTVVTDGAFAFQERLRDRLVDAGIVADEDHVFDLPSLVEGHHNLRSTPAGAGGLLPLPDPGPPAPVPAPSEPAEGTGAHDKVAAAEAEAPYARLLRVVLSADHRTAAMFILPPPESQQVAAADAFQATLEQQILAADPPADLDTRVYGFKRLARDLMTETQESLQVLYGVSLGATLALFWGVTRSLRATLVVALPVLVSSLWWFGLMRIVVGSLDPYQLLSLIFITSIGSDYAAYLVYKFRDTGDWAGTLSSTGRAVLFSAATDAGAFFVFSMTQVRSGGDMLLGAGLAIVAIFLATLVIVPPLLGWTRGGR